MGGIFTGRPDVCFHQFQRREQGVPTKGTGSTSDWNKQFQPSELPVTMLVANFPDCGLQGRYIKKGLFCFDYLPIISTFAKEGCKSFMTL